MNELIPFGGKPRLVETKPDVTELVEAWAAAKAATRTARDAALAATRAEMDAEEALLKALGVTTGPLGGRLA